jgi:hypothetical protein
MAVYATAFAPFAAISTIEYIDTQVVDCRVRGLYKLILRGNYTKARASIMDILVNLRRAVELDMSKHTYNQVFDTFARVRIDLARHRYTEAHDKLRQLHYSLVNVNELPCY